MKYYRRNGDASLPRLRRAHWLGLALFCPMVAAAAGLTGREEGASPPAETSAGTTAASEATPKDASGAGAPASLAVSRLRVGAPPFAWEGEGEATRLATFVTDTDQRCSVVAWARASGVPAEKIRWEVTPPAGFSLPSQPLPTGPVLRVTLLRPNGNPKGGGGPLTIAVRAYVEQDGRRWEARETITQDERDCMRQEYVDLKRESVPERYRFLDAAQYTERYGRRFPQIRFEELNWSLNPDTGERYRYVIVAERMLEGLARTRERYGRPLLFNSGYRNPTRQVEVHAPVKESLHQYGLAADLAVLPDPAAAKEGGAAAPNPQDWLTFAEAATAAGASWVEPLSESGGHLHVDFRDAGQRSGRVSLKGRVLDAETGEPVPGARVLLAGMPAEADAEGHFALRHVLTPRSRDVAVSAEGYQPLSQAVPILIGANRVELRLASGPRPRLAARAGTVSWKDEGAGLAMTEIRIRNTGERAACDLTVSAAAPKGAPVPIAVVPERLTTLPVGAEATVRLTFKLAATGETGPAKVVLRARGQDPDGIARAQRLVAQWTPPAPTPRSERTTTPLPKPAHTAVGAAALGATAIGATTVVRRRAAKSGAAPAPENRPEAPTPAGTTGPSSSEETAAHGAAATDPLPPPATPSPASAE
jgi:hypothetical protein